LLSLAAEEDEAVMQESNGHRALIFCQMKSYLEMIIQHVLIPYGIKYTELLSMHSGQQRFEIVEKFNTDSSI
jgi:SNF2 family DNA or RNA helicase